MLANTIKEALKNGEAIEIALDTYILEDNRAVRYDRYIRGAFKWICDDGYAYRNFFEVINKERYFVRQHNIAV